MDTASRGSPAAVSGRGRRALWDRAVPVPVHHRRCAVSSQCGAGGVRRRWVAAVRQHPGALVRTGHLHVGRETAVVRVPAHRSVHRGPHRCHRRQKAHRCMPEWEWPEAACLGRRRGLRHPHVVAHGQLRLDRARVGQLVVHAARMACVERRAARLCAGAQQACRSRPKKKPRNQHGDASRACKTGGGKGRRAEAHTETAAAAAEAMHVEGTGARWGARVGRGRHVEGRGFVRTCVCARMQR